MIATPGRAPTALFLSPHLDDVAFSCGGTLAALRRRGWRVALATVFTASVPRPSGFALACQLDKGLGPEVDYMAMRRLEDEAFARHVGVEEVSWLGLPEAPHRGYSSALELFGEPRAADSISEAVSRAIAPLVERLRPDVILAPQAIGGHVDHRQVVRAVLGLAGPVDRLVWYRDLPYAEKFPDAPADPALPFGLVDLPFAIGASDLEAKLEGCNAYATQVPFQFGDEVAMRRRLACFAASEAARSGLAGHVEGFLGSATAARRLAEGTLSAVRD